MSEETISMIGSGDALTAVLRGHTVSSFRLTLPDLPLAKLKKTLPFVLADRLASDNADLHYALMETDAANDYIVLVCDKSILRDALASQDTQEHPVKAIWPDYFALPQPSEGVCFQEQGEDVLCRRQDGTGYRVSKDIADIMHDNLPLTEIKAKNPGAGDFPSGSGMAVDAFSPPLQILKYFPDFKRAAVLALLFSGLWIVGSLVEMGQNNAQRIAYSDQAVDQFKKTFPDVKRVVNVESQLMTRMNGGAGGLRQPFLPLIADVITVLNKNELVNIETIRFNGASPSPLQISVSAETFSVIEKVKSGLTQSGFQVTEGSSEQIGSLIVSEFILSRSVRPVR